MNTNHILYSRLLAYILLLTLFLQSCNNFSNSIMAQLEEAVPKNQLFPQPIVNSPLVPQQLSIKSRYILTFQEQEGKIHASVKENFPGDFTSEHENLPVYFGEGLHPLQLLQLDKKLQERLIEVKLSTSEQTGHVYIGKRGLVGGMKRNSNKLDKKRDEQKETQEKEKEGQGHQTERQAHRGRLAKRQRLLTNEEPTKGEAMPLGDFSILPLELLQMILTYVPFPYILDGIRINHTFYELITGYTKVGLLGVKNRPNPVFYPNRWLKDKPINFRGQGVNKVPSVLFYCWMGEVSKLDKAFWPYLQGTRIHTLDLSDNKIGDTKVAKLAEFLPQTHIHTLNLSNSQIGAAEVTKLAEYLPQTRIHTLYLGDNQIGAAGVTKLAEFLPQTHIHTLDLSNNQIGVAGISKLAEYLPQTHIHTLYLHSNQIGDSGISKLAESLPQTHIHILYLHANQIGDSGISKLAESLPQTHIHTLGLSFNKIGVEMQQLLRERYPNITWDL